MVPPLVTASRSAPGRPLSTSRTRSHTMPGPQLRELLARVPARRACRAPRAASPRPARRTATRAGRRPTARRATSPRPRPSPRSAARARRAGCAGPACASSAPSRMRCAVTAAGTSSPRNVGNTIPRDTAPTWCPARPTRCSPLATDGGDPTCTTRSMAPMSMPSSSELVATTAGSSPALSSDSVRVRSARLIEPWCARARIVAASPGVDADRRAGLRRDRRCAQGRRVGHVLARALGPDLVHPRGEPLRAAPGVGEHERGPVLGDQVDDALLDVRPDRRPGQRRRPRRRTGRGRRASTSVPRRSDRSGTGTTTSTTIFLVDGGCTTDDRRARRPPGVRAPPRNSATASTGRTVADSPIRCAGPGRRGGRAGRRAVRARRRGARRAWCRRPRGSRRRSPCAPRRARPGRRT